MLHGSKKKPPFQQTTHPDKARPTKDVPAKTTMHQADKLPDGPTYTFGPAPNIETVTYKSLETERAQIQESKPINNVYQPSIESTRTNIPQVSTQQPS
ncbi:hypothetical protein, partial [Salmonella sp. s54925]|uniref:hypothetical protein n=1 Tax=Salmonella sp. s54925 TaxID=3159674 RepID=UPI00397F46B7